MNIFSTALSYLYAQSTLNFTCHLYTFKHIHKSNIKGAIFESKSSHLLWDRPYKEVLEVKHQACNFTSVLSFKGVFEDFGYIFPTCFLQNSHNLICNKFTILKNNRKASEAINFYFSNKLQFEQKLYYCNLGLITWATKMRAAGLRFFIF